MRTFRRILIVLVVLLALVVAVDRIGAWVAGRVVADQVSRELTRYEVDSGSPDASIGGFPFLTQVVSGEYEEITIRLPDVRADEVRMRDVELVATRVSASMSTLIERSGPVRAGRLDGTGIVAYSTVETLTGLDGITLSAAGGDEVAVRLPVDVLGASLTLTGTAAVSVEGNTVRLRVSELGSDEIGDLPQGAQAQVDQIASSVSVDVPLPALPYDLTIDSVRPADTGLAVSLSATDVPLSG